jgi:hypothetical protein
MSTDNHMPDWVRTLFEEIASGIEFKGFADMEGYYAKPDETSWGIHLLEMAPSLMDLSELGAEEGEQGYGIMHSFDLLATQEAFDEVAGLSFGIENDGRSCITIEGKVGEQDVVVLIYITPFEDTEDDDEIIKDNTCDEEE